MAEDTTASGGHNHPPCMQYWCRPQAKIDVTGKVAVSWKGGRVLCVEGRVCQWLCLVPILWLRAPTPSPLFLLLCNSTPSPPSVAKAYVCTAISFSVACSICSMASSSTKAPALLPDCRPCPKGTVGPSPAAGVATMPTLAASLLAIANVESDQCRRPPILVQAAGMANQSRYTRCARRQVIGEKSL